MPLNLSSPLLGDPPRREARDKFVVSPIAAWLKGLRNQMVFVTRAAESLAPEGPTVPPPKERVKQPGASADGSPCPRHKV